MAAEKLGRSKLSKIRSFDSRQRAENRLNTFSTRSCYLTFTVDFTPAFTVKGYTRPAKWREIKCKSAMPGTSYESGEV